MKWRWLIGDCIDPALELTREQKREARRRALKMPRSWTRVALAAVLCSLIPTAPMLVGMGLISVLARAWKHATPAQAPLLMWLEDILIPGLMILWLVLLLIIPFCAISLMGWALRPGVRAALRSMGYETCGKCGYWLRDLPDNEGRCPECGAPREAMTDDEG